MTGTNHVLTGIAIAVVVKNPIIAPLVAFVSHFALDMIPHFGHPSIDPKSKTFKLNNLLLFLGVDGVGCLAALVLALVGYPSLTLVILLSVAFSTLPDFLWILHYWGGVNGWFFAFAQKIQRYEKPLGLVVEIPFAILIAILLISHTI